MSEKSYIYAIGRVSVLETKLLPSSVIWGFLEQSWDGIVNQVRNNWFNQEVPDSFDFDKFEQYFDVERELTFNTVAELIPERELIDILSHFNDFRFMSSVVASIPYSLLLKYLRKKIDYKNLEIFLRGGDEFLEGGFYSVEFWKKSYKSKELKDLSDDMKMLKEELETLYKEDEIYLFSFCRANFEKKILDESKKLFADPSRLFYYFLLKDLEISIVRFFIYGKFYGVRQDKLRRVLEVYYG